MNKFFLKLLIGTALMSSITDVVATESQCPPLDLIKSANFDHAVNVNGRWNFASTPLMYYGNNWFVYFHAYLDENIPVNETEKALAIGTKIFHNMLIRKPTVTIFDYSNKKNALGCEYINNLKYNVTAISSAYFDLHLEDD